MISRPSAAKTRGRGRPPKGAYLTLDGAERIVVGDQARPAEFFDRSKNCKVNVALRTQALSKLPAPRRLDCSYSSGGKPAPDEATSSVPGRPCDPRPPL